MLRQEFKTELNSIVPICDIEISNDISNKSGDWFYENSDIITLGLFYGNKITILQREKEDKIEDWKASLTRELSTLPTLYCLNVKMEKLGLSGFLGKVYPCEEIRAFLGRGTSKDKFFEWLIKYDKIPKSLILDDPLKSDSSLVQERYANENYEDIILHNKTCLLKEHFIFINRFWFLEQFKEYIGKDGWWKKEIGCTFSDLIGFPKEDLNIKS